MIRAASRGRSFYRVTAVRPVFPSQIELEEKEIHVRPTVGLSSFVSSTAVDKGLFLSIGRRYFGSSSDGSNSSTTEEIVNDSSGNVDETLNKLFEDSQQQMAEAAGKGDSWYAAAEAAWDPTWYNLADQAILAVKGFHEFSGLEYGWSIVGVTVILRLGLFPLMVQSQRASSRMAHVQPELQQMKARYEAIGTPSRQDQLQFSRQMKSLFARYDVKPFRAFLAPAVQLPLFMGMFFGLRKMPQILPDELKDGGMYWFVDLTATDPYYILPLASATTFLALIEMGKDQMMAQNAAQGQIMLNVFRVLSIVMIPVCINFETAMLCYWTSNNILTMAQTAVLKTDSVREYFGIWERPKPVPGAPGPESLTKTVGKIVDRLQGKATSEKESIKRHNQAVDAKKKAFQMMKTSRTERRGITGTKSR